MILLLMLIMLQYSVVGPTWFGTVMSLKSLDKLTASSSMVTATYVCGV